MLNLDELQRIHDEAFKGYDDVHEWAVAAACWRDSILEHGAAMLAELRAGRNLRAVIHQYHIWGADDPHVKLVDPYSAALDAYDKAVLL